MIDHPIINPLGPVDQSLVEILAERWLLNWKWPVFDYLNRVLSARAGADAMEAMSRLPIAQGPNPQVVYRLIFTERGGPFAEPDQRVGLTVAGLRHVPKGRARAEQVVSVVRLLAQADTQLEPNPDRSVSLDMPVLDVLSSDLRRELRGWSPGTLAESLEHEPPLWGSISPGPDRRISVRGGRLSDFDDVVDVDDYVSRVVRWLGADRDGQPSPLYSSPLQLPEALGYLDAVWRLRFRSALLGRVQPAAAAKLALPCASIDELEARLSALSDVIGHFEVDLPPVADAEARKGNERSLARMRRRLEEHLESPGFERANAAIMVLQRVVRIRASTQHSGTSGEMAEAFRELRLPYPPSNPSAAWESIGGVTVRAVDAIREELQVADQGD
ncbi:MAG: hypothetical protein ABSA21_13720 [Candidatus Limnocylindrales bacterium]